MYLTDTAVMETLRFVAAGAPGTTIVFNFNLDDDLVEADDLRLRRTGASGVARQGEPWINTYDPYRLCARVQSLGFATAQYIDRAEFQRRYFDGRTDGLFFSSLTGTIVATV